MNNLEDVLSIETPENVAFGYNVADIGSRFMAAVVDTILIIVLQVIVNFTLAFLISTVTDIASVNNAALWLTAIFGLVAFALIWGYYILFEIIWNGQSPGKRWVGLRVLKTDGTPITLIESIVRNLVRLVDFLPMFYGVGVITMFVNERARRLGDFAAGTLVVYDQTTVTLEDISRTTLPFGNAQSRSESTANLPLERLTSQDIEMIENYLERRNELADDSIVVERIMQTIFKRMELPPPELGWLKSQSLLREIVRDRRNSNSE